MASHVCVHNIFKTIYLKFIHGILREIYKINKHKQRDEIKVESSDC